jgi:hypothetical protein
MNVEKQRVGERRWKTKQQSASSEGSDTTPTQPRLLTRRLTLTNVDIRDEYIDEERICEGKKNKKMK